MRLCQKEIPVKPPISNTYCMRPDGHTGKCSQKALPEDRAPKK